MLDLKFDLPDFAKVLFRPSRYKVLYGGRGAGRSWSVARALLVKGMQQPLRILCAREMQRSIQDSVHRLLVDQISLLKLPGYIVTQREIRHANGTVFLFEGLRYNITKIKSMEGIDICWVEEAEKVSDQSWNVLIPTIRKPGSEIWINFNPDQEQDATFQRFVVNPPANCVSLKVGWEDNPWFPEELREEKDYLYEVDPEAAAWVWGGETRQISDAQILHGKLTVYAFEPEKKWVGPFHGLDFGHARDPNVLIRCWIAPSTVKRGPRRQGRLMIRNEVVDLRLDLHKMPDRFRSQIPTIQQQIIRADSARPESISYLKQHGLQRIVSVLKWPGSIEDGIFYLRQFDEIVIHPDCKLTQLEGRLWSYKVDQNSGDVLPIIVDRHNNSWDAVRYALQPMIRLARRPRSGYSGMSYTNAR